MTAHELHELLSRSPEARAAYAAGRQVGHLYGYREGHLDGLADADAQRGPASVPEPAPVRPRARALRVSEAAAFLRRALADGGRPGGDVKAEAQIEGIAPRTLERARRLAGVRAAPRVTGGKRCWWWSLAD